MACGHQHEAGEGIRLIFEFWPKIARDGDVKSPLQKASRILHAFALDRDSPLRADDEILDLNVQSLGQLGER